MRITQFGALLVSNTNDYKNKRVGHGTAALVINSPFFYGGVPAHVNMSVLEVSFKHRNYSPFTHLPPPPPKKKLHNLCLSFLLGIAAVPREIENNAYAKCGGANKGHYGKDGSGV